MLDFINSLPPQVHVLLVAAIPIVELRGAIPLGILLGLPPWETFLLALIGNLAPIPFLYYLLLPVVSYLKKTRLFRRVVINYVARSEEASRRIKRYGLLGLAVFVSIPLPGTGAWSGCLVALLLGYSLRTTLAALGLGTLFAGTVVTILSTLAAG